jgi:hypothetical protein
MSVLACTTPKQPRPGLRLDLSKPFTKGARPSRIKATSDFGQLNQRDWPLNGANGSTRLRMNFPIFGTRATLLDQEAWRLSLS